MTLALQDRRCGGTCRCRVCRLGALSAFALGYRCGGLRSVPWRRPVPDGDRGATMAVTIDAPPNQVWPWLVQLGGDRGGWYSWDHLDNAGRPSAREVHSEWQDLGVGDHVRYWTRRHGPVDAWEVAALELNRFLGLHGLSDLRGRTLDPKQPRSSAYTEGLWGFLLSELPGARTRLVIGGCEVTTLPTAPEPTHTNRS